MVTGFLVVRLTPYMGAVVLNVVLQRRDGVPPDGGVQVLSMASTPIGLSAEEPSVLFSPGAEMRGKELILYHRFRFLYAYSHQKKRFSCRYKYTTLLRFHLSLTSRGDK